MKKILTALTLIICTNSSAQRVGIGTTNPHSSAKVEIAATDGGVLIPRLTTLQRTGINPIATGLLVYDSDTKSFWFYNGTTWSNLASNNSSWSTSGNAGTDSTINFIGTTDAMPLIFRIRNMRSGRIDSISASTSFGYRALSIPGTSLNNTAIGFKSLLANTNGSDNTASGAFSLMNNSTGGLNVAIGKEAMFSNTVGVRNVAIGPTTLRANTMGFQNIAIGMDAMHDNTEGFNNIAIGTNALYKTNYASFNVAIGSNALFANTTANYNTSIGAESMTNNTYGDYNTAIGMSALLHNEDGFSNTATGYKALYWNQSGDMNTAAGLGALENNSSGNANTGFGHGALQVNGSGGANTAVGVLALASLNGGSNNIALGYQSGTNSAAWNNTISIGNDGTPNGFHNQAFIGNSSTGWIGGYVGWSVYSDGRLKKNITEDVRGLDFITRLRPVVYSKNIKEMAKLMGTNDTSVFEGKYEIEGIRYSGFIAQEVEAASLQSGYDFSGIKKVNGPDGFYTLSYENFVVPLVKAVQEQQQQIEALKKQVDLLLKVSKNN